MMLLASAASQDFAATTGDTFTDAQKAMWVTKHNEFRRDMSVTVVNASNMLELKWNEELAQSALLHAKLCTLEHGDSTGQNIYSYKGKDQSPDETINKAFYLWGPDEMKNGVTQQLKNEKKSNKKKYGTKESRINQPGGLIAHATQMLWAQSHKIGCAQSTCGYVVCEYLPAGNIKSQPLFHSDGQSCSDCPLTHPHCKDGLCSMDAGADTGADAVDAPAQTASSVYDAKAYDDGKGRDAYAQGKKMDEVVNGNDATENPATDAPDCSGNYPTNYDNGSVHGNEATEKPVTDAPDATENPVTDAPDCSGNYPTNYDNGSVHGNEATEKKTDAYTPSSY